MKQRQPAEDHVLRARADEVGTHHLGVAGEVGVGELGALRLAGRAGCIEEHCGVLAGPVRDLVLRGGGGEEIAEAGRIDDDRLRVRVLGAAARFVRELMPGKDQPGPGVAEVISHLPPLEQRVHRDDHTACAEHAIVGDGELGDVGLHDPDPVAGLEARWRSIPATRALASSSSAYVVVASSTRTATRSACARTVSARLDARFVMMVLLRRRVPVGLAPSAKGTPSSGPQAWPSTVPHIKPVPGHWFPGTTRRLRGGTVLSWYVPDPYRRPDGGIREGGRPTWRQ